MIEGHDTRKVLKIKSLVEMSLSGGRFENSAEVDWRSNDPVLLVLTMTELIIWKSSYPFFEGRKINFQNGPPGKC